MQSPSHLALPAFTIHLKAFVDTWYDVMIWQHWQRGEAKGGSVIFLGYSFFQVFWSNTHPRVFVALKHIFSKKTWNRTWKSNHVQFFFLCGIFQTKSVSILFHQTLRNLEQRRKIEIFHPSKIHQGITHSWVGLMLQNSWQLQLIWKLISLICFHRALFFTSQVCRFCWVPDVYFTSSRCLNTLLPLISILSNLITDASQEGCWIKGILVTYFQNGRTGRTVKEWSANPEFEPGGICMWFYRISTKMNHQQAIAPPNDH